MEYIVVGRIKFPEGTKTTPGHLVDFEIPVFKAFQTVDEAMEFYDREIKSPWYSWLELGEFRSVMGQGTVLNRDKEK